MQKLVTRRPLPESSAPADLRVEPAYRIAFVLGVGAFVVACVLGVVQSFRSDRRLPSANVLVDGPAEHIETLLRNKRYDEAISALVQYHGMSNDRLPHERLGAVLLQLDADGRRGVAEALEAHPNYVQGHYQLGLAFLESDEFQRAQSEFEAVLRIQPGDAEAHNGLGLALAYQSRGEEAAAHFWNALRLRPDFEDPRINLGAIEPLLNRKPQAEIAPEAPPEPES